MVLFLALPYLFMVSRWLMLVLTKKQIETLRNRCCFHSASLYKLCINGELKAHLQHIALGEEVEGLVQASKEPYFYLKPFVQRALG